MKELNQTKDKHTNIFLWEGQYSGNLPGRKEMKKRPFLG
jgi:hypothetical protein